MTRLSIAALAALLCAGAAQAPAPTGRVEAGSLIYDGIPAASATDAIQLGRWLESRSASFLDWQADGSLIITTRFANVAQLHRVRAALGMREQLTWSAEPITASWATTPEWEWNSLPSVSVSR